MRLVDWLVLCLTLALVVIYGMWRSRGCRTVGNYMLAGRTMPWYAMGLSIMATQASAITFISTTGRPSWTACASSSSISDCRSRW